MSSSTTFQFGTPTLTFDGEPVQRCPDDLIERYEQVIHNQRLSWTAHLHLTRKLGQGGQGSVYLSERRGTDGFTLPVALKFFSPKDFRSATAYDEAMGRIATVSMRVAQIQQDNLLDVQNFVERNRIRIMEMEWVDGYDLACLLTPRMLEKVYRGASNRTWDYINNVVITAGPTQPRLKPGVAVSITRECLTAMAALHRSGIVHGDVKPSNIMLKRTGNAKIVDIGSAFEVENPPLQYMCSTAYAAPEVLEGGEYTKQSDLASLGYVLVEMLSGQQPFAGLSKNYRELLEAKRMLPQRLPEILPREVVCNELLMNFCRRLIAPDSSRRFPSAEEADQVKDGAASFLRQLVKGDLASEYQNDIRVWLEELEDGSSASLT